MVTHTLSDPRLYAVHHTYRCNAGQSITARGSFVGKCQDMTEALAFAAEGKAKADIELEPLSAINHVFERLEQGDVPSRVVIDFLK